MAIRQPYLLQRCSVKEAFNAAHKVSDYLRLDYMGSSEFEWGAIPKSLREMNKTVAAWVTGEVRHNGETFFFAGPKEDLAAYGEYLQKVFAGTVYLKESMRLESKETLYVGKGKKQTPLYDAPHAPYSVALWMDIGNHVVVARDAAVIENFKVAVRNSVRFMDEQAAVAK